MILGIDLGTCNSLAATLSNDYQPILIPDQSLRDSMITPSVVTIESNRALVGQLAESYLELNPNRYLIRYFKRHFGSPNPLFFDEKGSPWYSEAIAALVLKKIKYDAEIFGVENVEQLIITVPSHYNDAQRRSVLEAAKLADLRLGAIIDEPVAAALSYNIRSSQAGQIMLVYDFGGGTLDLTLITRDAQHVHVIAKDGVPDLGGKEFDEVISQQIAEDYQKAFRLDIDWDVFTTNKIRKLSEQIKIELSNRPTSEYSKWMVVNGRAFEFNLQLARIASPMQRLIDQSELAVNRCLRSSGLTLENIDKILLVGGTSQLPMIKEFWEKKLAAQNKKTEYYDPLNAVALGAAVYAQSLAKGAGNPINLKTVSSYNIFLRRALHADEPWDMVLQKNSPLPSSGKRSFRHNFSGNSFSLELGQSLDRNGKTTSLGKIVAGPLSDSGMLNLEVTIENRADGTLAIKLFNEDNRKEIKFNFERVKHEHQYNYDQQKKLVDSVLINNIL